MTKDKLRLAAATLETLDRVDQTVGVLGKLKPPSKMIWMGFLDGDGEGSYYGQECVPMMAWEAIRLLRGIRAELVAKLAGLDVQEK